MENSLFMVFVGGIIITAFLVGGGVFNLKRHDSKAMKASDSLTATANRVWAYLIPKQQEELKAIDSLILQEEWIENNVEPSVLAGANAERVIIELANRGYILLGQGVARRHASAIDFIEPQPKVNETISTDKANEVVPSEETNTSENTIKEEKNKMETEVKETQKADLPIILLTADMCSDCVHIAKEFSSKGE